MKVLIVRATQTATVEESVSSMMKLVQFALIVKKVGWEELVKHVARMALKTVQILKYVPAIRATLESIVISSVPGVQMLRVSTRSVCADLKVGEVICVMYQVRIYLSH